MVYLDYNASTPVDPRVAEFVAEVAVDEFGNASSVQHASGQRAAERIEESRHRVARLLGVGARDVIFTSGASEAAAIALLGISLKATDRKPNLVISATEHGAIISSAAIAARIANGEVRVARVDSSGRVDLDHLASLVDESVSVVAVMLVNNETGTVNPSEDVSAIAARSGAFSLVDVTQAIAKHEGVVSDIGADFMVLSSHKIYGPKGAGALVASREIQRSLIPILAGGGQESGLRGGTHNTSSIAGFGLAAEIVGKELQVDLDHYQEMALRLRNQIMHGLDGSAELVGSESYRIPNTLNFRFAGADSDAVMTSMPDIEVSTGSACHSAVSTPSHVLTAMGLSSRKALECIRFSVGRPTTTEEIDYAAARVVNAVLRVRQLTAN